MNDAATAYRMLLCRSTPLPPQSPSFVIELAQRYMHLTSTLQTALQKQECEFYRLQDAHSDLSWRLDQQQQQHRTEVEALAKQRAQLEAQCQANEMRLRQQRCQSVQAKLAPAHFTVSS